MTIPHKPELVELEDHEPDILLPRYILVALLEAANRFVSLDAAVKAEGQLTLSFIDEPTKPDFRKAVIVATALLEGP